MSDAARGRPYPHADRLWSKPPKARDAACGHDPDYGASRRACWYGRARVNGWPLWIAWMLAPSKQSREAVRIVRQMRKDGFDV